MWEGSGAFRPSGSGEPFSLPMPPPNITGKLHLGHAMFTTYQDILTRYKRMQGFGALWLPGTDHAGLATQTKLENEMQKRGIEISRTNFDQFAAEWRTSTTDHITTQLRCMGASCDWSRERYTLDASYSNAVTEALKRCHEAGMLYYRDGQWWLDMSVLAKDILDCYRRGEIKIIPEHQGKTLCHFLENIEPWCISRQIWWGHRLPIWRKDDQIFIGNDPGGAIQEEDCLDTWFSSALWPFAIHGWSKQTDDLEKFYPADLIETGDDILFFWCARMLMMGKLLTGQLAFKTIFLHGLMRDEKGRKMTKSLGNGIDPLEIITDYGTDGLRFYLAENCSPGMDINLDYQALDSGKRFANKIWQASRFCLGHYCRTGDQQIMASHSDDQKLLTELGEIQASITAHLDAYEFKQAAIALRLFIKDRFCDWYIEAAKDRLYADDPKALSTLFKAWRAWLIMLHPFMPFITERIWQSFNENMLITTRWPS